MIYANLSKKKVVLIMVGVMTGLFLAALDSTIVATVMPRIVGTLKGFDYYAWSFTAFLLCMDCIYAAFWQTDFGEQRIPKIWYNMHVVTRLREHAGR